MRVGQLVSVWVLGMLASAVGCGGSSFELPADEQDTGVPSDDTASEASGAETADGDDSIVPGDGTPSDTITPGDSIAPSDTITPSDTILPGDTIIPVDVITPPDTTPPPDSGCIVPAADATDLYVDGSVAATGTGSLTCPFKTILEATKAALTAGVKRIIHVKAMSYVESDAPHVRATVRLVGEGGRAKLSGGSTAACFPSPEKCDVVIDNGGSIESFDIDASTTGNGIVIAPTGSGSSALIKDTSVKNAGKDGVKIYSFTDASNVAFDENGGDGAAVHYGIFHVMVTIFGAGSTFDSNKGKGGSGVPGGGIVLFNTSTLIFDGGSVSNNLGHGVIFDFGAGGSAIHKITGMVAKGNGIGGLTVPAGQAGITLRNSTFNKNALYGVWLGYNSTASNKYDLGGATAVANIVFGGATEKNGKVGLFLCNSGATGSQPAEGDSWSVCSPTEVLVPNCDTMPSPYADIGYAQSKFSGVSPGPNPVPAPTTCKVGP